MSLASMQSRHMSHDIIIKALIEVLTEEQLNKVVNSVQQDFDAYTKGSDDKDINIISGLADAKQHASALLGKEIK
ncbi:hypothetical protein [Kluyvera ascorbata]|uniref:hypothetical protein n=1 Tax=Kluyvera ascorbata TaxID=51288 RepID=UPI0020467A29|nr:hypothetical protein [Kluyvera ascorbata]UPQ73500.1 hypothetical protein MY052_09630 [Kluyvera ascorbata]